ncbi:MAG: hypothetical protein CVU89_07060 [Firmicutes bacterium HGW-Firmicutes-14]|nr:MAG: hypothetical protein CVU89_07060 [Firmicutes bacterium HGW-Firmicutes-14]
MTRLDISNLAEQRTLTIWSSLAAAAVSLIVFFFGKQGMAVGIIFSCVLMVLNYWALSLVPWVYQRFRSPHWAKVAAFVYYYLRFWLLVLVLFLTVPKAGYDFGIGCFMGFLIPKITLGVIVIANKGEDWWLQCKDPAETTLGPEKKMTPLEKELANTNPFEFDIVDFEWKNYNKKK